MDPSEYAGLFAHEETMWWFVGMRHIVDELLQGRARAGMRLLEAGCGAGFNALDLARRYDWDVFACDYSQHALEYSAKRGVPRLAAADVEKLPYAAASFNAVTCFDVLVMLKPERLERALAEFNRVLRPGGLLITRVAALEILRGSHSILNGEARRYGISELRKHLDHAGFEVERGTYANMMLFPLAFLKRRVLEPLGIAKDASDVGPTPPWMNTLLLAALEVDRYLIAAGLTLPIGSSTVIVSRKR